MDASPLAAPNPLEEDSLKFHAAVPSLSSEAAGANLRYIILCRVSTGRQRIQGNSLENQLAWIQASIASGAPCEVHEVVGSVFKGVPLAMEAIFKAARSGDTILVYRVDRLGRNSSLFLPWLDKLLSRGVDVRSTSESLSYSTQPL